MEPFNFPQREGTLSEQEWRLLEKDSLLGELWAALYYRNEGQYTTGWNMTEKEALESAHLIKEKTALKTEIKSVIATLFKWVRLGVSVQLLKMERHQEEAEEIVED